MTAPYRIPFDHDPDWDKVGGGNWDDPVNPFHPYYAYDFGFPRGHTIRAARSGTVVDCVGDRVEGVDKAAGSGGGNCIYIRHYDGTVASYAHLSTNQVFVSKGDWVNQGQIIGKSGCTGESDAAHLHVQVMLYANAEVDYGPSVPLLFEDAAHLSWQPKSGDTVVSNNTVLRQENWRWRRKCQALFFGGNPASTCAAGGPHDRASSGEYFVSFSAAHNIGQEGWRWCAKCQSLFLGTATSAPCPAGGSHSAAGSGQYTLHQVAELNFAQGDWRYCHKCKGLYYARHGGSVCPADRRPHDGSQSGDYALLLEPAPVAGQKGWRWCRKCQGMFFGDRPGSVCPAGGAHDKAASGHYQLYLDAPKAPGQPGWRWCSRCQGLFFDETPGSVCPAGGAHNGAGSGHFSV